MRLSVRKENKTYVARIWFKQNLVFEQFGYGSREEATLDAWVNALFIKDIAVATEASVEALVNGL
jgi:hypothetical protein